MQAKIFWLFASTAALVAAVPTPFAEPAPAPLPTAASVLGNSLGRRGTSCTFTAASQASASKKSCATIVLNNIAVPAGQTLDLTGLTKGTHVIFSGTTSFGYKEWSGPLVSVSGTAITVSGASGHVLDGGGARWWDGKGTNGGKTKPKFFYTHKLVDSNVANLNIKNTPVQCFSVNNAQNLVLDKITIDNSAGDPVNGKDVGHNTDAFDVGESSNIAITNANIRNQDDCLAINSGSNITFTGGTCSGGHGLSIGSVGGRDNNDVSNVLISSSTVTNSQNGIRIKTVYGATGSVSGVIFKDITLSGITKYGIVMEQDYENGSPTGTPTTGVPITDLIVSNVKGSVQASATNVYLLCGKGSCSDWTWTNVSVTGGKTSSKCLNIPGGSGASC